MSTKTKTKQFVINNTSAGRAELKSARSEIRNAQKNTGIKLFSVLLNICGVFSTSLGFIASAFDGAISSIEAYLSKCDRVYTAALENLLEHKDSNSANYYPYATITHTFTGTYQGKNKGYVYKANDVSYKIGRN